jgi:hypothetical protein
VPHCLHERSSHLLLQCVQTLLIDMLILLSSTP